MFWILIGGGLTLRFRAPIRKQVQQLNGPRWLLFTLLSLVMVLVEEAVTVSMTNLAPLFGVRVGEAYITASTNYLDVIALHSVVVIVPQFAAWGGLLTRYAFSPFQVFLLFGLTGMLDEAMFGGPQAFHAFAQWIFVYGLMVYLPACCLPPNPRLRPVPWWLYPVALLLPILAAVPVVLLVKTLAPNHPSVHFPPIHTQSRALVEHAAQSLHPRPSPTRFAQVLLLVFWTLSLLGSFGSGISSFGHALQTRNESQPRFDRIRQIVTEAFPVFTTIGNLGSLLMAGKNRKTPCLRAKLSEILQKSEVGNVQNHVSDCKPEAWSGGGGGS